MIKRAGAQRLHVFLELLGDSECLGDQLGGEMGPGSFTRHTYYVKGDKAVFR